MNIAQAQTRAKVEAQFAVRKAMDEGAGFILIRTCNGRAFTFTDQDFLATPEGAAARDLALLIDRNT